MKRRVDIKLGFKCNNFCRFCIQADKRDNFSEKSSLEVKEILKRERDHCDGVIFTGGEPTLQKNLVDYIAQAKKLDYQEIHIQTNGRLLANNNYCIKLFEAGANVFTVSIHGSNAKIHDYLTCSPGSFEQTFKGIKNLKKLDQKIKVFVNTVIVKQNFKDLPFIAQKITPLNVNQYQFAFIHINHIIQKDPRLIEEIVPRYFEIEPYVKQGLQIGIDSKIFSKTEAIPYCFMSGFEDHISEKQIPDTNVYDANNIMKNFTEIRKTKGKTKGPNCEKCDYFQVCEGPWRDYPEIFGWDEFKPVKNK
jgi:sulfatase maturation enzyme AslB (radical SAM superfamily)